MAAYRLDTLPDRLARDVRAGRAAVVGDRRELAALVLPLSEAGQPGGIRRLVVDLYARGDLPLADACRVTRMGSVRFLDPVGHMGRAAYTEDAWVEDQAAVERMLRGKSSWRTPRRSSG